MKGSGSVRGRCSFPGKVMPLMSPGRCALRARQVILPGEALKLTRYLRKRRGDGMDVNLNQLGEAVLGEEEAARRLDAVIGRLRDPAVDYVSVKISAIFSQINLVAFDATLQAVKERLRSIYRVAVAAPYIGPDGRARPKFVNLDMEEYHDLQLTAEAFKGCSMRRSSWRWRPASCFRHTCRTRPLCRRT